MWNFGKRDSKYSEIEDKFCEIINLGRANTKANSFSIEMISRIEKIKNRLFEISFK